MTGPVTVVGDATLALARAEHRMILADAQAARVDSPVGIGGVGGVVVDLAHARIVADLAAAGLVVAVQDAHPLVLSAGQVPHLVVTVTDLGAALVEPRNVPVVMANRGELDSDARTVVPTVGLLRTHITAGSRGAWCGVCGLSVEVCAVLAPWLRSRTGDPFIGWVDDARASFWRGRPLPGGTYRQAREWARRGLCPQCGYTPGDHRPDGTPADLGCHLTDDQAAGRVAELVRHRGGVPALPAAPTTTTVRPVPEASR